MNQPIPNQSMPQPAPSGGYPAGAPYAGYPAYPAYGYPGYPYYPGAYQPYPQPYPQTVAPRSPSERPGKPGAARVRNLIVAAIGVVLTAAAIAAASFAAIGGQSAPSPVSGGLRQVYSQSLGGDAANWTLDQGCILQDAGLLADGSSSGAICDFVPSGQQDLLSPGFQLSAVMAPGEDVPVLEEGGIVLGQSDSGYFIDFTQEGNFAFYTRGNGAPLISGSTIAWHTDSSLANTITLRYSATSGTLDGYVNGQQVFSHALTLDQGTELALAAPDGAQALFTSFALYSAA